MGCKYTNSNEEEEEIKQKEFTEENLIGLEQNNPQNAGKMNDNNENVNYRNNQDNYNNNLINNENSNQYDYEHQTSNHDNFSKKKIKL